MRSTTRRLVPVSVPSAKRRLATVLAIALVWVFGAAACGVQETQDEVDKARQVEKQMDNRQQELEKMQEGY
jgi:uncharacterized protein (DUF697 family)